jgi:hypothetical protein
LRLALSKGPNRVGAPIIIPEDRKRSNFPSDVFLETLDDGESPETRFFQILQEVAKIQGFTKMEDFQIF